MQVFLVENDIFRWASLQATCFLEKWREKPEWDLKYRIHRGRRYWNKQNGEYSVMEICLGQSLSFHVFVCQISRNEDSVTVHKYNE